MAASSSASALMPPPPPQAPKSKRTLAAEAAEAEGLMPVNSKRKQQRKKPSETGTTGRLTKPPRRPPEAPTRDEQGRIDMLAEVAGLDCDEIYGEAEQALNDFLRLHPMLSLDSHTQETLNFSAQLVEKATIDVPEIEMCSKVHDDSMLCMPNVAIGERPCNLGNRCIAVHLARWRYGPKTERAFICKEFLLPSQKAAFLANGTLPKTPGKCLLCTRYYTTFLYRCARADPSFVPSKQIPISAYNNALGTSSGIEAIAFSNVQNDLGGYKSEAMLFADESWAESSAARSEMCAFLWRPVVKFNCLDYAYVIDETTKQPSIVQVGVGVESARITSDPVEGALAEGEPGPSFRPPAGEPATPPPPAIPTL